MMERTIVQKFNEFLFCLILFIFFSLGVRGQSNFNVDVNGKPSSSNWCFGDNYSPAAISIFESDGYTNGFDFTGSGDSIIVIITPPNGFVFSSDPLSVSVTPDFPNNDLSYTNYENHNTYIKFSFRTKGTGIRDSIALTGITLVPQTLDIGSKYGTSMSVTLDTCKDANTTVDTTYTFNSFSMAIPNVSASIDGSNIFCEMGESIPIKPSISGNDATNCNSYTEVKVIGLKPGGVKEDIAQTTGTYDNASINGMELDAIDLTGDYDSVYLAVKNGNAYAYSAALSVGGAGQSEDIELLMISNSYSFQVDEEDIGVNDSPLLIYSLLDTNINEGNVSYLKNDVDEFFFDADLGNFLVFDANAYLMGSKPKTNYRFEIPNDINSIYQSRIDFWVDEYNYYGCDGGGWGFPCFIFPNFAFNDTRHFRPGQSDYVNYSEPNLIIYRELHQFSTYNKNCSFLDTVIINVLPEDINVPGELCASDNSVYEIRVDTTQPSGFPVTSKFKKFEISIPNASATETFSEDSAVRGDNKALYFNFNPYEFYNKYADSDDILIAILSTYGEYDDSVNGLNEIRYYEKTIRIYKTNTEDLEIFGLDTALCYNRTDTLRVTSNFTIDSLTGMSVFQRYSGATIDWYVNPATSYDNNNAWPNRFTDTLDLYYEDLKGCKGLFDIDYVINPAPRVEFEASEICVDRYVMFNSENSVAGTNDELLNYTWTFEDGTIYSSIEYADDTIHHDFDNGLTIGTKMAPRHKYSNSGEYNVLLKIETTNGCEDTTTRTLRVEDVPQPDFEYSHTGLEQRTVEFTNTSVPSEFETDYTYSWNFADSRIDTTYELEELPSNTYDQHGIYEVYMWATTTNGCAKNVMKKVPVFPYVEVTDEDFAFYNFSETDGWLASHEFDMGLPSNWQQLPLTAAWYDSDHTDGDMWMTGAPGDSVDNETGWLESPCFDFRDLRFPMLSMDIYNSLEPGRDGAVIQYTVNDGKTWHRLGSKGGGVNWYNRDGIYSNPGASDGGINVGSHGWSKDTTAWETSRFILDHVRDSSIKNNVCVRFRIAYNSNDYHDSIYKGFAVDNFYIGKRKRIVLLEQLINREWEKNMSAYTKYDSVKLNDFVDTHPDEVVDIRYHVNSGSFKDPMFETFNNWQDNSVRASELGAVTYGPLWAMDGTALRSHIRGVDQKISYDDALEKRALVDPVFVIEGVETDLNGAAMSITATVRKISDHLDEKLKSRNHWIRFAIVQKEYTDEDGQEHRNVFIDLLPNGVGSIVEQLEKPFPVGGEVTLQANWEPNIKTTGHDFRLVIFICGDMLDGEVEQVYFEDLDNNKIPQYSTGTPYVPYSEDGLTVYPNPASEKIWVKLPNGFYSGTSWTIYSTNGQVLKTGEIYSSGYEEVISVEGLQNGFYLIRLTSQDGEQVTSRFTKEGY